MAAENYHLKWDSHLSYLNSSVATLYKNEKFADVMLYSSSTNCSGNGVENGIPTVGISAHKFILSSCSQFFATMFETSPVASPNGVLYVVLPPELSHRAIQILVQYMYSGEATVSNDILSEVLRGGELLKIRGLCRTSSTHANSQNSTSISSHYSTNGTRNMAATCHGSQPPSSSNASEVYASKCSSSRFSIEHQQHQFRGLGASVMPKDSPVIVKSPKIPTMTLLPPSISKHTNGGGISINKEVAIDPEDKCCYQEPLASVGSSVCTGIGCQSCSMSSALETEQLRRRQSSASEEQMVSHHMMTECLERDHDEYQEPHAMNERCGNLEDEEVADNHTMGYERRLRRDSSTDRGSNYYMSDPYEHSTTSSKHFTDPTSRLLGSPPQPPNFLNIKQEPSDWTTSAGMDASTGESRNTTSPPPSMLSPKQPLDFKMPLATVKLEAGASHSADEDETFNKTAGDFNTFTRLVCEVCKKSFDDPKTWVRHLETHASAGLESHNRTEADAASCGEALAKTYVPKKRRRVSQENSMDHVTLLCDICTTSFETPAEWVRHMNNQHTEIELAMFNSKKDSEQQQPSKNQTKSSAPSTISSHQKKATSRTSSLGFMEYSDKVCDICNKKFSSNGNMLLHKRSHSNISTLSSSNSRQQANGITNRDMNSATPTA